MRTLKLTIEPVSGTHNYFVVKVSEPVSIQTLTPAFGINLYPGTHLPFSFSPIFYYYWLNEDDSNGFEWKRF
jgi:hypothetical protein